MARHPPNQKIKAWDPLLYGGWRKVIDNLQLTYTSRTGDSNRHGFGGSHGDTGTGSVMSAMDFYIDNCNGYWVNGWTRCKGLVTAAHSGRIQVESDCYVRIVSNDGRFFTGYYHMMDMRGRVRLLNHYHRRVDQRSGCWFGRQKALLLQLDLFSAI